MTKREKFLLVVVFILFLVSTISAVYFVVQFLNVRVKKVEVEQKLHQTKNELELKKVEIEEKEKKIADLKEKISDFKEKVQSLLQDISNLKKEKEDLIEALSEIKQEFSDMDKALGARDEQIARLKQELMRTRTRLFEVEQYMRSIVKQVKSRSNAKTAQENREGKEQSVSLGKIVVGPNQGDSNVVKTVSARVLSINKKYNFAIFALPRGTTISAGSRVSVKTKSGREFSSVIDTVRNNLVTMDVPKDLDMPIGEIVQLSFVN